MTGRLCRSAQYGVIEPNGYPGTSSEIVESTPKLCCKNNRRASLFSFILLSIGKGRGENYDKDFCNLAAAACAGKRNESSSGDRCEGLRHPGHGQRRNRQETYGCPDSYRGCRWA